MESTGISTLFWIIILLISIQPAVRQRMIETARLRLMGRIEKQRGVRVISIVHRQETMSILGFPLMKYISMEDSEEVLRALESTDDDTDIELVLHTPGGLAIASMQIARAMIRRKGKVRVVVPHYAMSGGTLIALAADEIIMSENAVLGPVDPQLGEYPAPSLIELTRRKKPEDIDDKTMIYADMAEKAIKQMKEALIEILSKNYEPGKAQELAETLTKGTWTHDFPITADLARNLGLKVNTDMPREYVELMSMYPQPVRRLKSVEYLPLEKIKPS
ncbi:MAG: ATP-dependent Clp protease proteolytic subunit [Salibacteraceae bacterium]